MLPINQKNESNCHKQFLMTARFKLLYPFISYILPLDFYV